MEIVEVDLAELRSLGSPPFEGEEAFVVASVDGAFVGTCFAPWAPDGARLAEEIERRLHEVVAARTVERAVGDPTAWEEPAPPTRESVSVAVCTIDRLVELRRCLSSVARQLRPDDELIVVDNSAAGSAAHLASSFGARWVHERRRGSSWARNRAATSARHDVVVFIDDDCVADSAWLDAMRTPFGDPSVDAVTGGVLARRADLAVPCLVDRAYPFHRGWSPQRFEGTTGNRRSPHDAWVVGTGACMAWRRRRLDAIGGFDPALGSGSPMGAGEELDAFRRTLADGGAIVYMPDAVVWHDHPETMRALRRKLLSYAIGMGAQLAKVVLEERERTGARDAVASTCQEMWWQLRSLRSETANAMMRRSHLPLLALAGQPAGVVVGVGRFVRHRRRVRNGS